MRKTLNHIGRMQTVTIGDTFLGSKYPLFRNVPWARQDCSMSFDQPQGLFEGLNDDSNGHEKYGRRKLDE